MNAETELGYPPPTLRQFSVFLDNRVGKLLELLEAFEEAELAANEAELAEKEAADAEAEARQAAALVESLCGEAERLKNTRDDGDKNIPAVANEPKRLIQA